MFPDTHGKEGPWRERPPPPSEHSAFLDTLGRYGTPVAGLSLGVGAGHQESGDRLCWCLRYPMDDTAPLGKPLHGCGHRRVTLSQGFKAQRRFQLLRWTMAKPPTFSRGRALIDTKAERFPRSTIGARHSVCGIAQRSERKGQSTGKIIEAHEGEEMRVKSCRRNSITPRYKNCHAKPTVVTKVQTVQRITSSSKRVKNRCKV